MVSDATFNLPALPAPVRSPARAGEPPAQPAAPRVTAAAVEPVQPVERAIEAAASALFGDREIEVEGFRDEASGRYVYRVADRRSGEVLIQSPPDALLRFFASARAALGPFVAVEA
ncbi:MAG: hypothetical protein NZ555_16360 [Geminicoccaceae bacterium]|nr:hypothetical protein [Geminicoccaceae bacterium]MCX8100670.1 hypothetical protein [Geminicoccaceae bacterium]MDW8371803.1 hypothetical protein [Geminicoccaceae bacterium]